MNKQLVVCSKCHTGYFQEDGHDCRTERLKRIGQKDGPRQGKLRTCDWCGAEYYPTSVVNKFCRTVCCMSFHNELNRSTNSSYKPNLHNSLKHKTVKRPYTKRQKTVY